MFAKTALMVILLLHRLSLSWLVARIITRQMATIPRPGHKQPASGRVLRLLALNPNRFRGELEALAATGRVVVLKLPFVVTSRLYGIFFGRKERSLKFHARPSDDPSERRLQERFETVMGDIFRRVLRDNAVDGVLSAALHYRHDLPFGALAESGDVPYIVCHRESLHAAKGISRINVERWAPIGPLRLSHVIVHNEAARKTFLDAGIAPPERIIALGNPRMDSFALALRSRDGASKESPHKLVTFFSFFHGNGLGESVPKWSDGSTKGYVRLFEEAHTAFAGLAACRPDVRFVIKTKWEVEWFTKIREAMQKADIDPDDLPNLRITCDDEARDLIFESDVVCGFGSTTLLEAAVAGKPVIVPVFQEAADPAYRDDVLLREAFDCFDIATSRQDFTARIEHRLLHAGVDDHVMAKRRRAFELWISPLDGQTADRWVTLMKDVVAMAGHGSVP